MMQFNAIRLARIAIFTAMSVIGAFIKIPCPIGTIALDSCPGYFSALAFGYFEGALVAGLGHIITSANVGFPLGPLHILIALFMMVVVVLFRLVYHCFPASSCSLRLVVGVVMSATLNGFGALIFSPVIEWSLALTITPSLILASYINATLAALVFKYIRRSEVSG